MVGTAHARRGDAGDDPRADEHELGCRRPRRARRRFVYRRWFCIAPATRCSRSRRRATSRITSRRRRCNCSTAPTTSCAVIPTRSSIRSRRSWRQCGRRRRQPLSLAAVVAVAGESEAQVIDDLVATGGRPGRRRRAGASHSSMVRLRLCGVGSRACGAAPAWVCRSLRWPRDSSVDGPGRAPSPNESPMRGCGRAVGVRRGRDAARGQRGTAAAGAVRGRRSRAAAASRRQVMLRRLHDVSGRRTCRITSVICRRDDSGGRLMR